LIKTETVMSMASGTFMIELIVPRLEFRLIRIMNLKFLKFCRTEERGIGGSLRRRSNCVRDNTFIRIGNHERTKRWSKRNDQRKNVTPILDVSRKSSKCVNLVQDTLRIYNK
jgi:hypothetical protein